MPEGTTSTNTPRSARRLSPRPDHDGYLDAADIEERAAADAEREGVLLCACEDCGLEAALIYVPEACGECLSCGARWTVSRDELLEELLGDEQCDEPMPRAA